MVLKNCVICESEFDARNAAKTCSPKCSHELKLKYNRKRFSNDRELRAQSSKQGTKNERERRKDPEYRKLKNIQMLKRYHERMEDPAYRAWKRKQHRERRANNEYRERENVLRRERNRKRRANDKNFRDKENSRRQARRSARAGLAYPVTSDQWDYALSYFHGCCAICECQLDGMFDDTKTNQDHWMAHIKGGDYVATNIVPLCRTCNLSKHNIVPEVWLKRKYSKRKAAQIIERIETYFEHIKEQS